MKGKESKDGKEDCYAKGGEVESRKEVKEEAEGKEAENEESDDEAGEEKKRGGRVKKKRGGKIEGEGEKPHLGKPARHMRARGGGVGSDRNPLSSANSPSAPSGRKLMRGEGAA